MKQAIPFALGLALAGGLAAGDEDAPAWVRVTERAPWQPRDSCGEVVFKDRLWILGGWFDSFSAPPRDVWSSADGKTWDLITRDAPWRHSDLPMTVAFKDRIWMMGGWYNGRLPGHEAGNQVWASEDGARWERVTAQAGWSPRLAAGAVVFKGRLWVLGGTEDYYFGDDRSLKNDVWSSADGVNWESVTEGAPWSPRIWFSAVAYRDRLWVLGGWSNHPSKNWGDVWYSRDGKRWSPFPSRGGWKERHEHSAYVFGERIWIAGGHAQPLSGEVWSLAVPPDWFKDR